jgi:phosphopantothenoylcysteine synthetase/decarboxylase
MTSSSRGGRADDGEMPNLLVGVCGAGAVLVMPEYLMYLQSRRQWRIRVVMTPTAARILPPATVRLVCEAVFCDGDDNFAPGHVGLASWSDHIIVLPATAHVLGQAAHGLAGNLLGSTLLASEHAVMFFPSMNRRMWEQSSVQRNVAQLRSDGHFVVEPVMKSCWEIATSTFKVGPGLPPPAFVAQLVDELGRADRQDMNGPQAASASAGDDYDGAVTGRGGTPWSELSQSDVSQRR